jgi:hypothetical protein
VILRDAHPLYDIFDHTQNALRKGLLADLISGDTPYFTEASKYLYFGRPENKIVLGKRNKEW